MFCGGKGAVYGEYFLSLPSEEYFYIINLKQFDL